MILCRRCELTTPRITPPLPQAATANGIPVGNTPGVLTETTAEIAAALTLAAARRVVEARSTSARRIQFAAQRGVPFSSDDDDEDSRVSRTSAGGFVHAQRALQGVAADALRRGAPPEQDGRDHRRRQDRLRLRPHDDRGARALLPSPAAKETLGLPPALVIIISSSSRRNL